MPLPHTLTAPADRALAWWFTRAQADHDAACTSDHITLSMIDTLTPNPALPVERIRVAHVGPGRFVWHATLGLPVDPNQPGIPSAVRHVVCAAGATPTREAAHQAAGKSIGFLLSPFLTLDPRQP